MAKRLEGREEPIVDPGLPIIDAHHHLFDRPQLRYLLDDYLADATSGHKIVASVFCEAGSFLRSDGPEVLRPIGEVEFANGMAAMAASGRYGPCRIAAGIVGHADMRLGEAIGDLLDRALATAPERFRGVRQISLDPPTDEPFRIMGYSTPANVMESPGFLPALHQLQQRNLTYDVAIFHNRLGRLAEIAAQAPDVTFVLNHIGQILLLGLDAGARGEALDQWRKNLAAVAERPNVMCKVGGLGLAWWGFGFDRREAAATSDELAEAWRPFVETGIELFGVDRCMMQSNFPADGRSCGFVPLWNALKKITCGYSADERAALFHGTAARVYRLRLEI